MHAISVHIDENVSGNEVNGLRQEMLSAPHVRNVEMRAEQPHDMLVEFDEHHNVPMSVLHILQSHGLHADIVGC
jgi:hypothetical protein